MPNYKFAHKFANDAKILIIKESKIKHLTTVIYNLQYNTHNLAMLLLIYLLYLECIYISDLVQNLFHYIFLVT